MWCVLVLVYVTLTTSDTGHLSTSDSFIHRDRMNQNVASTNMLIEVIMRSVPLLGNNRDLYGLG